MADPRQELAELEELDRLARKAQGAAAFEAEQPKLGGWDKAKIAGEVALDRLSQMGRGGINTLGGLDTLLRQGATIPSQIYSAAVPRADFEGMAEKVYTVPPDESKAETYSRRMLETVPSLALAGPAVARAPFGALATTMGSGAAGQAARDVAPKGVKDEADMLAQVLASLGLGTAFGPNQGYAQGRVKGAMEGITPNQWREATRNAALMRHEGVQTATLPEMFTGNTALKAIGNEVASSKGGEILANQLSRRPAELEALTEAVRQRAGPAINVQATAVEGTRGANEVLSNLRKTRSASVSAELENAPALDPRQVMGVYSELINRSHAARTTAEGEAYRRVADQLVAQGDLTLLTRPQDLSKNLRRIVETPPVPDPANPQRAITANDLQTPWREANQMIGALSQPYQRAMRFYGDYTQNVYNPVNAGIVGDLSATNPSQPPTVPGSRLSQITADQDPQAIMQAFNQLRNVGAPVDDIASALVRRPLEAGSTDPGKSLRGLPGSPKEAVLRAVISGGGRNPAEVLRPAEAADLLQGVKGTSYVQNDQPISKASFGARPMTSLAYVLNQAARARDTRKLAELLRDPRNLSQIQEYAQFDPTLRGMLSGAQAINALSQYLEKEQ